jgi:hypothetical protein
MCIYEPDENGNYPDTFSDYEEESSRCYGGKDQVEDVSCLKHLAKTTRHN